MSSNWINFVKNYSRKHNIPYSKALREAKIPYNKYKISGGGGGASVPIAVQVPTAIGELSAVQTASWYRPQDYIDMEAYRKFKNFLHDTYDFMGHYGPFDDDIDRLKPIIKKVDRNRPISDDDMIFLEDALNRFKEI